MSNKGRAAVRAKRGCPPWEPIGAEMPCSREGHQVDRPPTVPCTISAPQRGQLRLGGGRR